MCNVINLDVIALMYIVGGSMLGFLGVRAYRQYLKTKQKIIECKPHSKPQTVSDEKDFSFKGD
jgi:hypothetical protein